MVPVFHFYRAVGWRALLALVPPLLLATALLAAAGHLPSDLGRMTALRAGIGVLLAGAYPLLLLLAVARPAEGLSTGPDGHRLRLPRVRSRAVRRPDRADLVAGL